jgi:DNA-binding NarL/FixJ family response regulator
MARINIYTEREILALGLVHAVSSRHDVKVAGIEHAQTSSGPLDAMILDAGPDTGLDASRLVRNLVQSLRLEDYPVPLAIWQRAGTTEPALNALILGVRGVLFDTSSASDVLECLDTILSGGTWVPPSVARAAIVSRRCQLTRREEELMTLVAGGSSNKEIALTLGLEVGTVKVYLSHLFRKLGVSDRYELALLALRHVGAASVFVPRWASDPLPAGVPVN